MVLEIFLGRVFFLQENIYNFYAFLDSGQYAKNKKIKMFICFAMKNQKMIFDYGGVYNRGVKDSFFLK